MHKLVVGYDGTEESRDALALAGALRKALAGELVVAVIDEIEPLLGDVEMQLRTREAYFEAMFAEAEKLLAGAGFERMTSSGSASAGLESIAIEADADAIVIGSTHRGTIGRVLPGSVGDRLLAGSAATVVIAPRRYAEREHPPFSTIGVGYDGLGESRAALTYACSLARSLDASLRVITATPTLEELIPGRISKTAPGYAASLRRHYEAELAEAVEGLQGKLEVEPVLREGRPFEVLADQTVELDLLVLGSRRYGPLRRVLVGSVASKAIAMSACPVIVAPRTAEEPLSASEAEGLGSTIG